MCGAVLKCCTEKAKDAGCQQHYN